MDFQQKRKRCPKTRTGDLEISSWLKGISTEGTSCPNQRTWYLEKGSFCKACRMDFRQEIGRPNQEAKENEGKSTGNQREMKRHGKTWRENSAMEIPFESWALFVRLMQVVVSLRRCKGVQWLHNYIRSSTFYMPVKMTELLRSKGHRRKSWEH